MKPEDFNFTMPSIGPTQPGPINAAGFNWTGSQLGQQNPLDASAFDFGLGNGPIVGNQAQDPMTLWQQFQNMFSGAFDTKTGDVTNQGWLAPTAQAGAALWNAYNGMGQLDLARESFDFQKQAYAENLANQKKNVNMQLTDRQNARLSANPTAYASVDDYMKRHGV